MFISIGTEEPTSMDGNTIYVKISLLDKQNLFLAEAISNESFNYSLYTAGFTEVEGKGKRADNRYGVEDNCYSIEQFTLALIKRNYVSGIDVRFGRESSKLVKELSKVKTIHEESIEILQDLQFLSTNH